MSELIVKYYVTNYVSYSVTMLDVTSENFS
jgi:hypothetical protein